MHSQTVTYRTLAAKCQPHPPQCRIQCTFALIKHHHMLSADQFTHSHAHTHTHTHSRTHTHTHTLARMHAHTHTRAPCAHARTHTHTHTASRSFSRFCSLTFVNVLGVCAHVGGVCMCVCVCTCWGRVHVWGCGSSAQDDHQTGLNLVCHHSVNN